VEVDVDVVDVPKEAAGCELHALRATASPMSSAPVPMRLRDVATLPSGIPVRGDPGRASVSPPEMCERWQATSRRPEDRPGARTAPPGSAAGFYDSPATLGQMCPQSHRESPAPPAPAPGPPHSLTSLGQICPTRDGESRTRVNSPRGRDALTAQVGSRRSFSPSRAS
jgi:hypothetical protein